MNTEANDLLDTAAIAQLLGLSRRHVTERLTKAPTFPAPAIAVSRQTKRWRRGDVLAWAGGAQPSRAAMSSADSR